MNQFICLGLSLRLKRVKWCSVRHIRGYDSDNLFRWNIKNVSPMVLPLSIHPSHSSIFYLAPSLCWFLMFLAVRGSLASRRYLYSSLSQVMLRLERRVAPHSLLLLDRKLHPITSYHHQAPMSPLYLVIKIQISSEMGWFFGFILI